jgi:2-dehydropantoate 2-reductase
VKIGVMGAGAIGCWIGGRLAAAGADVVLVGRERACAEIAAHGLTLTELDGAATHVAAADVTCATDASALAGCAVVLVAVKSAQTREAAASVGAAAGDGAVVVSLQNGVRNADVIREELPRGDVLGGIVGFNVRSLGEGAFRRATSGPLVVEASPDPRVAELAGLLRAARFDLELAGDIRALQWAKLIMNLNNAVSALSDRPTRELLFTPGYRRVLRALMKESIDVLSAAGISPGRLGPLPVKVFPLVLSLPTPLLRVVARAQLKIDPEARSSMWEDISRGRPTEVDELNGEIVRLAEGCGARAPLNARIVTLVHEAEARGEGSPRLGPAELSSAIGMSA